MSLFWGSDAFFEFFYLLDSSDQVLDKKSPEVMEGLQLSALCGREKKQQKIAEKKEKVHKSHPLTMNISFRHLSYKF